MTNIMPVTLNFSRKSVI